MNTPVASLREFDAYVAVDWSANSKPKTGGDSIWVAWGRWGRGHFELHEPTNPSTRADAMRLVTDLLRTFAANDSRVMIGFDFAYGYPAGFADALCPGTHDPGWLAVWDELSRRIKDSSDNSNNRFEVASALNAQLGGPGPFWACPPTKVTPYLSMGKSFVFPFTGQAGRALSEHRAVEQLLRSTGQMVHSTWKLFTSGSVGSQALVGIPHLARLVNDPSFRDKTAVWPFETGFQLPERSRARIVHVEIWPGLFNVEMSRHKIKDAAQVLSVIEEFARRDAEGSLAYLFTPTSVPPAQASACQREEGWIFGA